MKMSGKDNNNPNFGDSEAESLHGGQKERGQIQPHLQTIERVAPKNRIDIQRYLIGEVLDLFLDFLNRIRFSNQLIKTNLRKIFEK